MAARVTTEYFPKVIEREVGKSLYDYLVANVPWEEGVRSKQGTTRLAWPVDIYSTQYEQILPVILAAMDKCNIEYNRLMHTYLNYYVDGTHWTPSHTHKDTIQVVISLGASRKLTAGSKEYKLRHGSVIKFGSIAHGIPKDTSCNEGRISIALFIRKA